MELFEIHARGMLSDRSAVVLALVASGWDEDTAHDLVTNIEQSAVENNPRKWQRWTAADTAEIDKALVESGWKVPSVKVTRPLAERLGRSHKSLLSAMDRRIAEKGR
jgi:hypothetical protein